MCELFTCTSSQTHCILIKRFSVRARSNRGQQTEAANGVTACPLQNWPHDYHVLKGNQKRPSKTKYQLPCLYPFSSNFPKKYIIFHKILAPFNESIKFPDIFDFTGVAATLNSHLEQPPPASFCLKKI